MSGYFPSPKSSGRRVKNELDFSNYATKTEFKHATDSVASQFDKKVDLANLKPNVDKLDMDKLKTVVTSLSNLKSRIEKLDLEN